MSSTIELIHGEASLLLNREYDVIIADPPYSRTVHDNVKKGQKRRALDFEHLSPATRGVLARLVAKANRWSVVFSDWEHATYTRIACQAAGATYVRTIPWVRWSSPQLSGDRPPSGSECVMLFWGKGKGRKSWNGHGGLMCFDAKCLRGKLKHTAEKPLDLILQLVDHFSNPGETVVDPFFGSGTTALACRLLGRNFLGTELQNDWYEHAMRRVERNELCDRDRERYQRFLTKFATAD